MVGGAFSEKRNERGETRCVAGLKNCQVCPYMLPQKTLSQCAVKVGVRPEPIRCKPKVMTPP